MSNSTYLLRVSFDADQLGNQLVWAIVDGEPDQPNAFQRPGLLQSLGNSLLIWSLTVGISFPIGVGIVASGSAGIGSERHVPARCDRTVPAPRHGEPAAPPALEVPRVSGVQPAVNNKPTYLSKDGLEKLRAEFDEMVNVRRPEVAARIHDAKEHGDLSENAEYEDAKNEQAFVEGRIQTLEALIKNATIIDENHSSEHVGLGSTVHLESHDGGQETFTIVGSREADPANGRISYLSPIGAALMGRRAGDDAEVATPSGRRAYRVVEVR